MPYRFKFCIQGHSGDQNLGCFIHFRSNYCPNVLRHVGFPDTTSFNPYEVSKSGSKPPPNLPNSRSQNIYDNMQLPNLAFFCIWKAKLILIPIGQKIKS